MTKAAADPWRVLTCFCTELLEVTTQGLHRPSNRSLLKTPSGDLFWKKVPASLIETKSAHGLAQSPGQDLCGRIFSESVDRISCDTTCAPDF